VKDPDELSGSPRPLFAGCFLGFFSLTLPLRGACACDKVRLPTTINPHTHRGRAEMSAVFEGGREMSKECRLCVYPKLHR